MSCDNVPTTVEIAQAKKDINDFNTFMTSEADTFVDSKGVSRLTLQGAVNKFGFGIAPFTFTEGGTLLNRKLLVSNDPVDGFLYRYVGTGDFPITVTAGTDPTFGTDWEAFTATSAEFISNANGGSVQDFINVTESLSDLNKRYDTINPNEKLFSNKHTVMKSLAVIHTGQSLAEGGVGFFNTPTLQPLNSKCFTLRNGPVSLETNQLGITKQVISEKIRATIGNTLSDGLVSGGSASVTYFSGAAWGGKNYEALKKGGSSGIYEKCISQVGYINALDSDVIYKAVTVIHGEQDGVDNNANYAVDLGQWQSDFNTDIKSITGQSENVKMFLCQTATAGGYGNNGGIGQTTFPTPLQQLIAHKINSNITLVGSKYQYKYADNVHLTNLSQAQLGEKYSQAINYELQNLMKWEPVRPVSFDKNGNQITITFTGSMLTENSPLVFDTLNVNAITNYGFAYSDGSGNTITSVVISEYNKVVITLSGNIGSSPVVAYAYHNGGGVGNQANGYGDRGNLRDSSIFASKCTGENLPNWCVIFRESI